MPATIAGREISAMDWQSTPLGAISDWPASLTSLVSMMLACPTPMFMAWGPDLNAFYNDAYIPILGRRHDGAMGKPFRILWGDIWDDIGPLVDATLAGGSTRMVDMKLDLQREGVPEESWWTFSYSPVHDESGNVVGMICVTGETTQHVIAERERAEARLRESEARYRQIVEGAEDFAIVTLDADGVVTGWNSGATRITGYREDEALGQAGAIIFTPGDRAASAPDDVMNRALADGRAPNERWHIRKDGGHFWGSGLTMKLDQQGGGYLMMFRDRTAEHEAEVRREALAELTLAIRDVEDPADISFAAAALLGSTLGVSRVGYAAIDHDNETLHVDRDWRAEGVETLVGVLGLRDYGSFIDSLKRGEFTVIRDVRLDPRTSEPAAAAALEAKSTRSFVNAPVVEQGRLAAVFFVNHDEVRDWSEGELELIRQFADRTRSAVERARGQQALRQSEESLRQLNETLEQQVAARSAERDRLWNLSQDMLARADFTGMISAVSPAWTQVLGWSAAELLSRGYATFRHPDDVAPTLAAIGQMAETRLPSRFENRIATRDGGWKHIDWTVAPEPDGANFIAIGRDLSYAKAREAELQAAQEALRQSQKMEAMGSLTGGVAHDFNNLLTPIVGSLDLLKRKNVGGEREQRLIAGAIQSAERAKTLVQRLLAFARRQPLQATAVDIGGLVENMADLIASTTGPQIKVAVSIADGLRPAIADPNQLEMALLNLAVNARDAMPDGGTLRITATNESIEPDAVSDLAPGDYVRLSVADTGSGMDEETLKRAIEPFFSTKGVGKGTGLGLSMVHGLALQLGGTLTIQSRWGVGTNVGLWLPVSQIPAEDDGKRSEQQPALTGAGIALLVDDEELVRMSTADMLSDMGYEVVEAASAEQALHLIAGGLRPQLLVTDHLMPGMTGTELARKLRTAQPEIQILVVSGYAESEGVAPDLPRLTKPFRSDELAAILAATEAGSA